MVNRGRVMGSARSGVKPPDFDAVYLTDEDPWRVESSWYERRKLDVLLAALPREVYETAWEPGCGPGFTTRRLAARVRRLLATDGSAVAVSMAADRCSDLAQVRVERQALPAPPGERFDLIVVAEFLYYVEDFHAALEMLWDSLGDHGQIAFLHWRKLPHDAHRSGEAMHDDITAAGVARGARVLVAHRDEEFRLDILERP